MLTEAVQAGVPDGVQVWRLRMQEEQFDKALTLLSADERWRACGWRQPQDRVRFALTRAALRQLLAKCLGCAPRDLNIRTCRHGKPYLAGVRGLDFNVAHAGDFGMIALSQRGAVGIDIEYRKPGLDDGELRAQALSHLEQAAPLDFFERWVGKEAVLKALGVGIGTHLQQLSVLGLADGRYRLAHEQPGWPPISACQLPAPAGYAAALAWLDGSAELALPATRPRPRLPPGPRAQSPDSGNAGRRW